MSPKIGVEDQQKDKLINAVLECVSRVGIKDSTLDMIAREAGCAKGIIAYYFGNKDRLMLEAFRAFFSYYARRTGAMVTPGMGAAELLTVIIDEALPPGWDHPGSHQDAAIDVSSSSSDAGIHIPPMKKGRLFVGFLPKLLSDPDFARVFTDVYSTDLHGIARVFKTMGRTCEHLSMGPEESAWAMLCLFVGASVFRVSGFKEDGIEDNGIIKGIFGLLGKG